MSYQMEVFNILACIEMHEQGYEPKSDDFLADDEYYVREFGEAAELIITVSDYELNSNDSCEAMTRLVEARCDTAIRAMEYLKAKA